jgi:rRNA maturation RNase YbeY
MLAKMPKKTLPIKKIDFVLSFSLVEKKARSQNDYLEVKKVIRKTETQIKKYFTQNSALLKNFHIFHPAHRFEVGLHFCADIEMRGFQKQFRNLDRTTDILSFPSSEGFQFDLKEHNPVPTWGDLIVSLDTVIRGAKRAKRHWSKELNEVLIHGVLHLLGYDHVKGGASARLMKDIQKNIFSMKV